MSLEHLLKEQVTRLIGADLEACEASIERELGSSVSLIREVGHYMAGAGGKRIRPILVLLSARLAGYRGPRAVHLGCVVELLHTATLMHDDVVDRAILRRGHASANAKYGEDTSILVGDHFYSKSFALLVQDNDQPIMETLARATLSMTEAEVFQLEKKREGNLTENDYLRIITLKTATFISACCRIGALLGGASRAEVEALAAYGLNVGIAFQIVDDSLDFIADEAVLGKAIGTDLREGKRTLPLIATLDRATPADREWILEVLHHRQPLAGEIGKVRRLVMQYDGISYALEQALSYAKSAKTHLANFPDSEEKDALALISEYVVDRDR
jgi:octaprenyl-diphosphate synthase